MNWTFWKKAQPKRRRQLQFWCITENPKDHVRVGFWHYWKCLFLGHDTYMVEWIIENREG